MSAVGKITFRYLRLFKGPRAVTAMTIIAILGIAIGVATMIVTYSVANGFGNAYKKSILDFSAHAALLSTDEIKDAANITAQLSKYYSTKESRAKWADSAAIRAMIKPVRSLWIKLKLHHLDALYSEPSGLGKYLNAINPAAYTDRMFSRGWYPKALIKHLTDTLALSENGIVGVSPFIYREGLLISRGQIRGVVIKGVNPEGLQKVSNMKVTLPVSTGKESYMVVGSYLARELGLKEGDNVKIMLPEDWNAAGEGRFREFTVAGTFESGMYDFDSQFVLLDLKKAQEIFNRPDTVSGIEIKLDDSDKTVAFGLKLERDFEYPLYTANWQELNKSLFDAVKLEKIMFAIIMGALVIVAAFNIIGTVMLRVLYKTSDIAILRALGMRATWLQRIFVFQGLLVGGLGTFLGLAAAVIVIWLVGTHGLIKIPEEIYLVGTLPVCFSWNAGVLISAFSLFVCWVTSVLASKRIFGLSIVRGLHRP